MPNLFVNFHQTKLNFSKDNLLITCKKFFRYRDKNSLFKLFITMCSSYSQNSSKRQFAFINYFSHLDQFYMHIHKSYIIIIFKVFEILFEQSKILQLDQYTFSAVLVSRAYYEIISLNETELFTSWVCLILKQFPSYHR